MSLIGLFTLKSAKFLLFSVSFYENDHNMITKEKLQHYISERLSTYKIAKLENCSQSSIKHWLNKYELKTNPLKQGKHINCLICNKALIGKQIKFCSAKCQNVGGNINHQIYKKQQERGLTRKLELISMRGCKCEYCGYNTNLSALQFHHLNPKEKDHNLDMRKLSNSTWEWCLKEFAKCQVLCANCHAETHFPHLEISKLVLPPRIELGTAH
jgi:predicted nucleic acid-binding Zn ribbon protein